MTDDDAGQPHAADRCFILFVVVFSFAFVLCHVLSSSFTVDFFHRPRLRLLSAHAPRMVPYATRESRMVPQTRGGKKPCRPDA